VVWVAGTGLAVLGGVFLALSQQVSYLLGFQILLLLFAGVTLGGIGTAFGALVGSLVIGIFTQLSTLVIPAELQNVGRPDRPHPHPGRAAPGHPRPGGARRMTSRSRTDRRDRPAEEVRMDFGVIFNNTGNALLNAEALYLALAAIGLNVHFGYTGLLNFGQVGFLAIAAYGLGVGVTVPRPAVLRRDPARPAARGAAGAALGIPTLRLRADYLAIVTIASSEVIRWSPARPRCARSPAAPPASPASPTASTTSTRSAAAPTASARGSTPRAARGCSSAGGRSSSSARCSSSCSCAARGAAC
jgi:hypothetical protein